jgi:hypothetical protein
VPSVTLSLWWKKFSKAGVYAAFIVGILVTIIWIASGLNDILTVRIASFAIPFPAAVIASLLFPKGEISRKTERLVSMAKKDKRR